MNQPTTERQAIFLHILLISNHGGDIIVQKCIQIYNIFELVVYMCKKTVVQLQIKYYYKKH